MNEIKISEDLKNKMLNILLHHPEVTDIKFEMAGMRCQIKPKRDEFSVWIMQRLTRLEAIVKAAEKITRHNNQPSELSEMDVDVFETACLIESYKQDYPIHNGVKQ